MVTLGPCADLAQWSQELLPGKLRCLFHCLAAADKKSSGWSSSVLAVASHARTPWPLAEVCAWNKLNQVEGDYELHWEHQPKQHH